jgi:uncharacterized protein YegJ (DUF2314 family)
MTKPYLTSLDEQGWEIDDAEIAHEKTPESYWIPPLQARQSLVVGACAKIRFYIRVVHENGEPEDCGERMWVEVLDKVGDWYRGQLSNQPTCTKGIAPGMEVWFQARHAIAIEG